LPSDWRDALLDRNSFAPVLLLCVATMVAFPFSGVFRGAGIIVYPLLASLVVISLQRSHVKARTMRLAISMLVVVGLGVLAGAIAGLLTNIEERHLIAVSSFLFALLFAVVLPSIIREALGHRRVNLNTLTATISAYLIIGLLFTMLYQGLATFTDYRFFNSVARPTPGDFEYFSFITLTTVGYGDLAPITPLGRAAAVAEAVIAQVFLVTTVARVVSMFGSERPIREGPAVHDFRSTDAK
jgi:hypothetical protein